MGQTGVSGGKGKKLNLKESKKLLISLQTRKNGRPFSKLGPYEWLCVYLYVHVHVGVTAQCGNVFVWMWV